MKQCFLVVGPESSGNRLLAGILIRAGCIGDASTEQVWDRILPENKTPAVVIRSFPHGDIWPDLTEIHGQLVRNGYIVTTLITVRNPIAAFRSQMKAGHVANIASARNSIEEAYRRIFRSVRSPFYLVPYSALTGEPDGFLTAFLEEIGLPPIVTGPVVVDGFERNIVNQNAKHY